MSLDIATAVERLRGGGVVAYPTEAVWGLGCDPFHATAVHRLLALKSRPEDKGLILVAAEVAQLDGLVDWEALTEDALATVRATWPGPATWIVPATARVPRWITGTHAGVAVRVSAHPVVVALCRAFGAVLVSTSANTAGAPAPRRRGDLEPGIVAGCDGLVAGETGTLDAPTTIRDARTGDTLRG